MELRTVDDLRAATAAAKQASNGLGQDDFMTLMMEQMKNQDPLKPTDNTEFISQMAQLTSVSSMSEMNDNLASLADSLYSGQLLDASSLIGKDVLVNTDVAALGPSGNVNGQVTLPVSTNALDIDILAPNGEVLGKVAMGPQASGPVQFSWDGIGLEGQRLPPGSYTMRATYLNGQNVEALETQVRNSVMSVSVPSRGGSPLVQVEGMGSISLAEVIEIS